MVLEFHFLGVNGRQSEVLSVLRVSDDPHLQVFGRFGEGRERAHLESAVLMGRAFWIGVMAGGSGAETV